MTPSERVPWKPVYSLRTLLGTMTVTAIILVLWRQFGTVGLIAAIEATGIMLCVWGERLDDERRIFAGMSLMVVAITWLGLR